MWKAFTMRIITKNLIQPNIKLGLHNSLNVLYVTLQTVLIFVYFCVHNSAVCNFNLVIRVGEEGDEIENNAVCHDQIDLTISGAALITCAQVLFGDWISIIKSSSDVAIVI